MNLLDARRILQPERVPRIMLAGGLQDRGIRPSFLAVSDGDQGKEVKNDSREEQQSAQSCKHEKRQRSLPRQAECFHQQAKNKEYAGELHAPFEGIANKHYWPPFQNLTFPSVATLCTTS